MERIDNELAHGRKISRNAGFRRVRPVAVGTPVRVADEPGAIPERLPLPQEMAGSLPVRAAK